MDKSAAFGDAYNCELFFTPPIWSGIFVTSILALIMIWGLVMIMDIRTMDQFDDPKGKTITVNVAE
jgi:V-type H+-transporting ATPase S1 subunit